MKRIVTIILALVILALPVHAFAQCEGNLTACEQLLDEESANLADCDKAAQDCEARSCGWVSLIKDKTFMAAVIGGTVLLVGGIAGLFIGG